LILSYCRHHRLWRLSVIDAIDTLLFSNAKLKRKLRLDDAREVLDWMTRKEGGRGRNG
jgi:ESCRT-II complex subunit VPS25